MTENRIEKRYNILTKLAGSKRDSYNIQLQGSFISIRNNATLEGIYTDNLQSAKRWIIKDMNK